MEEADVLQLVHIGAQQILCCLKGQRNLESIPCSAGRMDALPHESLVESLQTLDLNCISAQKGMSNTVHAREKLEEFWRASSQAGAVFSPVRSTPFDAMFGAAFGGIGPMVSATYNAFDTLTRTVSPYEFNPFDINPLRDILEKCIDFEKLAHCNDVKLFINATNVKTGKI